MIRLILTSLLLLFISCTVLAQNATKIHNEAQVKSSSKADLPIKNALIFKMSFGRKLVSNTQETQKLPPESQITKIQVYYTDYPKGGDFRSLNIARIERAKQLLKDKISVQTSWELIKQIELNEQKARGCFHGLVVHYSKAGIKEIVEKNTEPIEEVVETSHVSSNPVNEPVTTDSIIKEKAIEEINPTKINKIEMIEQMIQSDILQKDSSAYMLIQKANPQNAMLVVDWTSSMYGYGAQTMIWLKGLTAQERKKAVKKVLFFNDGDDTPEGQKELGRTGGIYTSSINMKAILANMKRAMQGLGGGDLPENDIEALLKAQKACKKCDLLLVADAASYVRDAELIKKIKRPVDVILCVAAETGISPDYLTLAYRTGGTLYTTHGNLSGFRETNKKGVLKFGKCKYRVRRKRVELVGCERDAKIFEYKQLIEARKKKKRRR